jgi:hypothetical protein
MASLPESLRRQLEKTIVQAREEAEKGARAAIERLAVGLAVPFAAMSAAELELRDELRAHARQLGDPRKMSGEQEIEHLMSECAYEHWHRMLFARFLAENRLLIHADHDVPVTLAECEELAAEAGGEDGWTLAARFAAQMLPAIFRPDDPVLSVRLAPEHQQALEKLLAGLPCEIFTAADALGWVYQFWQSKRKKEVDKSGIKIGADELPAVTQLFTEPYMVHFLLHNTLGAWWAGKVLAGQSELAIAATNEEALRNACELPGYTWNYLRFIRSEEEGRWRPAAGTFDGWPESAAELTVFDPCCGSGHFMVEAFHILVAIRREEEKLSAQEACGAVLRDNLFGLEIDERCTQIAAFNLAFSAWTYPEAGGYRLLPKLQIACSGLSVGAKEEEWLKLAGKDDRLRQGMLRLYHLFRDAPTLGSLIDPQREIEPQQRWLQEIAFDELRPLLDRALQREDVKRDAQAKEIGLAAQGMAKAAALLAGSYALVITNVPYLGRGKQGSTLRTHLQTRYDEGKADLATAFVIRCLGFCAPSGSSALVSPQNWLFLTTYTSLRKRLLANFSWDVVAWLGPNAFQEMNWWAATTCLFVVSANIPTQCQWIFGIDVSSDKRQIAKAAMLRGDSAGNLQLSLQKDQRENPDSRVMFWQGAEFAPLADHALSNTGIQTGDNDQHSFYFWELPVLADGWELFHRTAEATCHYGGRRRIVRWEDGQGALAKSAGSVIRGLECRDKYGVLVHRMNELPVTLFTGNLFDQNGAVLVPKNVSNLAPLWCFTTSSEYAKQVRVLDTKTGVTPSTLVKVPFDLTYWQRVARERYPNGLPEPESDDPTQWLFHGRPEASTAPLHVALARLLGYRWPAEFNEAIRLSSRARGLVHRCDELLDLADADGVICIPPVQGEQPAADRVQKLLAQSFEAWGPVTLSVLLDQAGFSGNPLEEWLRDSFFEQHCQLFYQRPFIWHIWDGRRRDGFAALVNYHKLDRKLLERLTYSVLGDWISYQRQGAKAGELGAEDRLAAAETLQGKLALILEGEPPFDIFVRWKPLAAQPVGWEPDLNDGVRMNIRPFVEAGVLRKNPRIKWTTDRGAEPRSLRPKDQFPWFWEDGDTGGIGERVNDRHYSNAEKRAALAAGGESC